MLQFHLTPIKSPFSFHSRHSLHDDGNFADRLAFQRFSGTIPFERKNNGDKIIHFERGLGIGKSKTNWPRQCLLFRTRREKFWNVDCKISCEAGDSLAGFALANASFRECNFSIGSQLCSSHQFNLGDSSLWGIVDSEQNYAVPGFEHLGWFWLFTRFVREKTGFLSCNPTSEICFGCLHISWLIGHLYIE